jgi:transmembrane sensor
MAVNMEHEQLFIDYLNGESSEDEIRYIQSHFSPKDQKKILNRILKKYWNAKNIVDRPERYQEMLDTIHKKIERVPFYKHHAYIDYWYYSKMAASFLIFISVILYFSLSYQPIPKESPVVVNMVHKSTAFGQKLNVILPDGSAVVLNSGTTMSYPEIFSDNIRQIELEGEAYFEVRNDSERPFVVKSNHMEVRVLGTSFNFNTLHSTVTLTEGKVQFSDGDEQVILSKGQMARLSGTGLFEIDKFDYTQQIGWKDGIINIEDYTVAEIINILEKWYGVTINTKNVNMQKRFSGKFSHRSLENILEGLCFALDCNYKINNKNVEIY